MKCDVCKKRLAVATVAKNGLKVCMKDMPKDEELFFYEKSRNRVGK